MSRLSDDTKRKLGIALGITLIISMLVIFYLKKQYDNYNYVKKNKNEYLVYAKEYNQNTYYSKYVPYVNIKGETAKLINSDINSFVEDYLKDRNTYITYEYDINGDILSLLIEVIDNDTGFAPEVYFKTYNYNMKEDILLDDMRLLELFGVDETIVENVIENKFRDYYDDIIEANYYNEKECSYTCFLKYRNVDNYLDNVAYYVKNGNLIAYKPFIFTSIFGEEDYFKEKHFKFTIKKGES